MRERKSSSWCRTVACFAFPADAKHGTVRDEKFLLLPKPRTDDVQRIATAVIGPAALG